jgi:hypothetical protein
LSEFDASAADFFEESEDIAVGEDGVVGVEGSGFEDEECGVESIRVGGFGGSEELSAVGGNEERGVMAAVVDEFEEGEESGPCVV